MGTCIQVGQMQHQSLNRDRQAFLREEQEIGVDSTQPTPLTQKLLTRCSCIDVFKRQYTIASWPAAHALTPAHPIEPERLKRIGCSKQLEEVVCPKIVANRTKDGYP